VRSSKPRAERARATWPALCAAAALAAGCGTAPAARDGVARPRGAGREDVYCSAVAVLERTAFIGYKDYGRGILLARVFGGAPGSGRRAEAPAGSIAAAHERPAGGAIAAGARARTAGGEAAPRRAVHVQLRPAPDGRYEAEVHVFEEVPRDDDPPLSASEPRPAFRIAGEDRLRAAALRGAVRHAAAAPSEGEPRVAMLAAAPPLPAWASARRPVRRPPVRNPAEIPLGADDLEALGTEYLRRGRYDVAAAVLAAAAELRPAAPFTHWLLAHAEILRGGPASPAAAAIARGIDVNPDWLAGSELAAKAGGAADLVARAGALERALAASPDDADLRLALGYALHALGEDARAVAALEPLRVRFPGEPHYEALLRIAWVRAAEARGRAVR
jgi:hypothetical protein